MSSETTTKTKSTHSTEVKNGKTPMNNVHALILSPVVNNTLCPLDAMLLPIMWLYERLLVNVHDRNGNFILL